MERNIRVTIAHQNGDTDEVTCKGARCNFTSEEPALVLEGVAMATGALVVPMSKIAYFEIRGQEGG